MRESSKRGMDRDLRSSALWGTGGRGGEGRSSALWGKGGRGFALLAVTVLALAAPIAASAKASGNGYGNIDRDATWVAPDLSKKAVADPNATVRVIIQSSYGSSDAAVKLRGLGGLAKLGKQLDVVGGVAAEIPAKFVPLLAKFKGLTVTVDSPVKTAGFVTNLTNLPTSTELWPHVTGNARLWPVVTNLPTIAVIDSGIDKSRGDFDNGARVLADVNLTTGTMATSNSAGDGRGHGTFVAGIAAGSAVGKAGAAPKANLVSLDVMNDQGMAYTSDVISATNWILQNKDLYNIKVANFSLHSSSASNFTRDPLDRAVEKLWFAGVTVVAAVGNYGTSDTVESGVRYAPGNDPFVITVGAVGTNGTAPVADDTIAPWSAWGHTYDGFAKPEIVAPGRYMVGPVPTSGTLYSERPDKVVAPGYMQLSGTSFSAPVVSGTAAYLLALHPTWGPDQVKGALMKSARDLPLEKKGQAGVGEMNAVGAALVQNAPNPNQGLEKFLVADPAGGTLPLFDDVSWLNVAKTDVSWNSVSWADVSWGSVSWLSVSWLDVSWSSVSWSSVSWLDVATSTVSWADVSWADSCREDAVLTEPVAPVQSLDSTTAASVNTDPALNQDPSLVDHDALGLAPTAPVTSTPLLP